MNPVIYCINLKDRSQKRKYMKNQAKRRKININFHMVNLHKNPKQGCLNSHFEIIKIAKKKKLPYVLILEDDAKIIKNINKIPKTPEKWDMLYLGGYIKEIFSEYDQNWDKMSSWCTHAYIINESIYDVVLNNFDNWKNKIKDKDKIAIDEYYIDFIHQNYLCYNVKPQMIVQLEGDSDIDNIKNKWKNFDWNNQNKLFEKVIIDEAEKEITSNNMCILKSIKIDPINLPNISIITPTYNRKSLFPIPIRNFYLFDYPKDKMEWIILDDGNQDLSAILPKDERIKYFKINRSDKLNVSQKRNLCIQKCNHDIIVHMDDDDYYFPHSLRAKIQTLIKYPNKKCVSSGTMGYYNLIENYSLIKKCYNDNQELTFLPEASMAYYKSFWDQRKYNEAVESGEFLHFLKNRYDKVILIPYEYNMIAFTHHTNTSKMETNKRGKFNYWDTFDSKTKEYFTSVKENI